MRPSSDALSLRLVTITLLFILVSGRSFGFEFSSSTRLNDSGIEMATYSDALVSCEAPTKEGVFSQSCQVGDKSKKSDQTSQESETMIFSLRHRDTKLPHHVKTSATPSNFLFEALRRDERRLRGIHRKISNKREKLSSKLEADPLLYEPISMNGSSDGSLTLIQSTVESGASLGSGEYFIDVYMGTPPRHFSMIIDTGSDLTWLQCSPCENCYTQEGPVFDPAASSSYKTISCADPECGLVYSGPNSTCQSQNPKTCNYYYWYGDQSNTTGEFAKETVTLNMQSKQAIENVMFGCGHSNIGLFHGAGGLLGLGRGALSFPSQLGSIYKKKFSYCLVDRNNNMSVSSTLIFGDDGAVSSHADVQYTPFVQHPKAMDTFYYLKIKTVSVGGEVLPILEKVFEIDEEGHGGTIIDSGTTLTYLAQAAYDKIKAAFEARIDYPRAPSVEILELCYNVSGHQDPEFPELMIQFENSAVLRLPKNNYFIQPYPDEPVQCLAILGASSLSLSIIGNYQQQNIHILYDSENGRLGFAPMACSLYQS